MPYCGFLPPICKENQRYAIARREVKRRGESTSHIPPLLDIPKVWHLAFNNFSFQSGFYQFNNFSTFVPGGGTFTPTN